jgi:hypothetical protein
VCGPLWRPQQAEGSQDASEGSGWRLRQRGSRVQLPPRGGWDPGAGCQRRILLSKRRDFCFVSDAAGEAI